MPYDAAFRTGIQELPRLVIRFTDSVFHREYADTAETVYSRTQLMTRDESQNLVHRAADSHVSIVHTRSLYECESSASKDMGPRSWDYARPLVDVTQVDLNNMESRFPSSAAIFLRPPAGLKNGLVNKIDLGNVPSGHESTYAIAAEAAVPNKRSIQEMLKLDHRS